MNHTTNYNLSQWDAEDKVLRTDFNADNAKIDAALKKMDDRGLQLIREFTTTEAKNPVTISLADIDWTEWRTIHVHVKPARGSSKKVYFCYSSPEDNVGLVSTTWNHLLLCPFGNPNKPICGIFWGDTCKVFVEPVFNFSAIPALYLNSGNATDVLAVGTKIMIWGEKM